MNIILASKNFGKTQEIQQMFQHFPLKNLQDYGIEDDCEETGETFEENASIKAKFYAELLKNHESDFCVLSDDSGILVDALPGELGVKTRRWGAGEKANDQEWMDYFLQRMEAFPEPEQRRARFVSVAALWKNGEIFLFRGEIEGFLARELQAPMIPGIGLSSLFIPDGFDTVFSLLPTQEKNRISHRGKAFAQVQTFLTSSTMLTLYTYPACPYCDRVRDFLAEKQIPYQEVNALPSTPGSKKLQFLGGKQQVPFLVDESKNVSMYESMDIIAYLEKNYA